MWYAIGEIATSKYISFLMNHFIFPFYVWQLVNIVVFILVFIVVIGALLHRRNFKNQIASYKLSGRCCMYGHGGMDIGLDLIDCFC